MQTVLPFENLLADLRRHGFAIGLDHHLRLQSMLAALDGRCVPSDLRTLLCPIFAASEQQQKLFYSLFDHHFPIFRLAVNAPPVEPAAHDTQVRDSARKPPGKRPLRIALLVAAVAVAAILLWRGRTPLQQPDLPPAAPVVQGVPEPAAPQPTSPAVAPEPAPTPITPEPPADTTSASKFPTTLALATLIVLIPAVWFLAGEVARWRRRRLILQRHEGRLPPHSWPVQLQGAGVPLHGTSAFYTAARRLHTRQAGAGTDFDIGATIDATIRSGGLAAFHYQRRTRLPDYLVLIDRSSFRDHQAHLFDSLTEALHEEGLFLERFFYEGDPRECWTESSDQPLSLVELQRRYAEHRLVLFGDGAALLDPVSGELSSWTRVFSAWPERAVLSPVAAAEWSVRERRLAAQFLVLPGTQEGLLALADHFRSGQSADSSWPGGGGQALTLETPSELKEYLGGDAFVWLCACAVYPELHWDLTLHIACLPSLPPGLLNEEYLLKLVRLPWFRTGVMPDELRYQLIRELSPGQEREIRSAVIELVAKTPAPEGTIAADRQKMEIVFQRYFLTRQEGASAGRLRRILDEIPERHRRDYVALRALDLRIASPLDFLLPQALRKMLYVGGQSPLGIRGTTRLVATLAVIALGFYSLMAGQSYFANRTLLRSAEAAATGIIGPVQGAPLPTLDQLHSLDALRQSLQEVTDYEIHGAPLRLRWGFYLGHTLLPPLRREYYAGFRQLLFGQTQGHLLDVLQGVPAAPGPKDDFAYGYETLKSYLLTTSEWSRSTDRPLQDYLSSRLLARWSAGRDAEIGKERMDLAKLQFDFYARDLHDGNPYPEPGNDIAVKRGRVYLSQFSGAEWKYQSLLSEAAKNNGSTTFNREFPGSSELVTGNTEVSWAFTREGWVFVQDRISNNINVEPWVLDTYVPKTGDQDEMVKKTQDLYRAAYVKQWRDVLFNSRVNAYASYPDASKKLMSLTSANSPLLELFWWISYNTGSEVPGVAGKLVPEISEKFKAVQTVVPPSKERQYRVMANQGYLMGLSDLRVAVDRMANKESGAEAAMHDIAMGAKKSKSVLAFRFPSDLVWHIDKQADLLLTQPITNLENIGNVDLRSASKGLNTGTLIVVIEENDVTVFVNNQQWPSRTARGQVRIPWIGSATVRVSKLGFEDQPAQTAEVREGEEVRLAFKMKPMAQISSLDVVGPTPVTVAAGDVAVVVHSDVPVSDLTFAEMRKIMLGDRQGWNASLPVTLIVRAPAVPEREILLRTVYQMTEAQFRQYWISKVFRDEAARAPLIVYSDEQAAERVGAVPGSIAFVGATNIPKGVKVLRIDGRLPGESGYPLHVTPAVPGTTGMEAFEDPSQWKEENGVFRHRGQGFFPYKMPANGGVFTFNIYLIRGGGLLSGARLRWRVGYIDDKNYTQFELDDDTLYARDVVNGNVTERRLKHNIPSKDKTERVWAVQIDLSPDKVVHQIQKDQEWITIDTLAPAGRNLTEGKFGFWIQGAGDEMGLSDLTFRPHAEGTFNLITNPPGLRVLIDGRENARKTPLRVTLSAGTHQIEVFNGVDKRGFSVEIKEGQIKSLAVDWTQ